MDKIEVSKRARRNAQALLKKIDCMGGESDEAEVFMAFARFERDILSHTPQSVEPVATDVAALVEADRNTDTRGYVVGNGDRTKWRKWLNGDCIWTDDPREATRFFFRSDANAVHHEDEDAWCIIELRQALAPFTKGQDDE